MSIFHPYHNHLANPKEPPGSSPTALSIGDREYWFPGYEASLKTGYSVVINKEMIAQSLTQYQERKADALRNPPRDVKAHIIDWNLWVMSQVENTIDLLIGETLAELKKQGLKKLGYVKIIDFAREEYGFGHSATYELVKIATELKKYPLAKEAYLKREINKSSLRCLFQMLNSCSRESRDAFEKRLVALAGKLTFRGFYELFRKWNKLLEAEAAAAGNDEDACAAAIDKLECIPVDEEENQGHSVPRTTSDDDDTVKGVWVGAKMPVPLVALWDYALEWARRMEEAELPQWEFVELLLAEYLASCPVKGGDTPAGAKMPKKCAHSHGDSGQTHRSAPAEDESEQGYRSAHDCSEHDSSRPRDDLDIAFDDEQDTWRKAEKDMEETSRYWSFLPWSRINVTIDKGFTPDPSWFNTPHIAAQKLREMQSLKESIAYHQGMLLRYMRNGDYHRELMFTTITYYAKERLGMPESTVYSRIRMAGYFQDHRELEEEYLAGKLSQEQVMLLGKIFDAGTDREDEWIDYAKKVPVLGLGGAAGEFLRMAELYWLDHFTVSPWEVHGEGNRESGIGNWELGIGRSGEEEREDTPQMCGLESRNQELGIGNSGEEEREDTPQMCGQESRNQDSGIGNSGEEEIEEESPQMCGLENRGSDFGVRDSGEEKTEESIKTSDGLTLRFYVQAGLKELWGVAAQFYREHCDAEGNAPCLAGFVEALLGNFLDTWCSDTIAGAQYIEPLRLRNLILARDGYRCQVPGCTCRRFMEVHHVIYRSHGGSNDGDNLITLCGFHHRQCVHNGYVIIKGKAPGELMVILGIFRENSHPVSNLETASSLARFLSGIRIRQNPPPADLSTADLSTADLSAA